MKQVTDFAKLISGFLGEFLPNEKGVSTNTIKSYSFTFILLIRFMQQVMKVPATRLTLGHLTKEVIVSFLDWLQKERKCGDATRNQRLAALSTFIKYAEYTSPSNLLNCHQILSIPIKRTVHSVIDYMTLDGMKLLLLQPDLKKPKGIRDLTLLSLMYESAARVQEIIDLTPESLYIVNSPYRVKLHGKADKYRFVPLPDKQVELLKKYMAQNGLLFRENVKKPLFPNAQGQKMTRNGVNNILMKYVKMAKAQNTSLMPNHLSCHAMRHSKAMQLLESNVQLIHIRDFLGHKSVLTTEIYARTNPKYTFEAVKNAYKNITADEIPVWEGDNELMKMLKELSR